MNRLAETAVLTSLILLIGCDSAQEAVETPPESSAITTPQSAGTTGSTEQPNDPSLSESAVRAMVQGWLLAQNESNFEAYQSLYAPRFEGVKRVGSKVHSYDRAGWLQDRQRMFARKMEVRADDITVRSTGRSAVVRFEQTWASGDFKDVGPKQLVVVPAASGPKIAREEMLRSQVARGGELDPGPPYRPRKLALFEGSDYVVLATDASSIETGEPALVDRTGKAIAALTDPPPELTEFLGQAFVIHRNPSSSRADATCEASIESLHVLAQATPHFGQVRDWRLGTDGNPPPSDAQVAAEIWELAGAVGQLVVGRVDRSCEDGSWAHLRGETPTWKSVGSPARGALGDQATEVFRGLAGYEEIQKEYREWTGETGPWDGDDGLRLTVFERQDKPAYLVATAEAGRGCGDFRGEFSAAFEIIDGKLVILNDGKDLLPVVSPHTAVETSQGVAFIASDKLLRKVGPALKHSHAINIPFYDCGC